MIYMGKEIELDNFKFFLLQIKKLNAMNRKSLLG